MDRWGRIAIVAVVLLLGAACHKKTVAPPAPTPAASAPGPETRRPRPTPTEPVGPVQTPAPSAQPPSQPAQPPPARPSPAQPEFRLGQTLTPEEQRANNALIDQHLRHAIRALESLGDRPLTDEQKATVAQIHGFIAQARQMRSTDVVRARSLAERADTLTQDLVARVRGR